MLKHGRTTDIQTDRISTCWLDTSGRGVEWKCKYKTYNKKDTKSTCAQIQKQQIFGTQLVLWMAPGGSLAITAILVNALCLLWIAIYLPPPRQERFINRFVKKRSNKNCPKGDAAISQFFLDLDLSSLDTVLNSKKTPCKYFSSTTWFYFLATLAALLRSLDFNLWKRKKSPWSYPRGDLLTI